MLKSLIIGTILSTFVSAIITKAFKVYSLTIYTESAIGVFIILYALICIIYNKFNDEANNLIINNNTLAGYITGCVIFVFVDLRSSMLFLCVLSLQYIYLNTGWSLTRNFVNLVLLLTLARSLTTILFKDLIEIGYTQVKIADYWLDIASYYVVYTYTLVHWFIYYIVAKKEEDQSSSEVVTVEVKA
jgi:hypothetical protein